ncbi:MAG TPA: bifunctional 5,10-methylenetetrahydrofolate dehydrogenase/5,10-methenyltetrahydrofolate cyclohydrolase [Sedimentibacter sp.]|jgi:methylenetetrahydrofolate dehydrogenase (NADP+)/methenyltetrahydrofolate cyclohydrolase|nr:bifunctional 5,10-methylenetetrahydrofolate dehydrogenase/5,10-methenyltetrahydrofolate cyclohydrolase [Sedimentibacter sp.]NLA14101.1 bifunctional 5,10-methylenetetrahydrofolate dehydrogenase/5,10-methenyltetrahydrofolate cyclohydrolase [Tissierellia bacterium]HAS90956.1 bifunctional 5,10-methylene-tetrahydrofolate dehydrogenase/5,10-methylene-tetrahydrofolate cyclohydrolase [Clostridiales bacterium]HOA19426.1 bifunctional 5,10-methylenetetrahydrofolate dehydrogenase/5,10-methenyltetrahydrof
MGILLKGKPVADSIVARVKDEAEELRRNNIIPKLKIIRVGEREDDLAYERAAVKRMKSANIDCEVLALPLNIDKETFEDEIKNVVNDNSVHGILVFRPLPKQLNEKDIRFIINPEKDIDCLNPINAAKILEGDESGFPPCTARAAMEILKYYNIDISGKEATVIGRSMVVGKPLSMMLLKENSTVTICHSKTENLPQVAKRADILIAAIGKSKMITKDYIKENSTVIDVGINADDEGNITGDVNTEDCIEKAAFITPVPAGVGSVTTAVLADHVVKACRLLNK